MACKLLPVSNGVLSFQPHTGDQIFNGSQDLLLSILGKHIHPIQQPTPGPSGLHCPPGIALPRDSSDDCEFLYELCGMLTEYFEVDGDHGEGETGLPALPALPALPERCRRCVVEVIEYLKKRNHGRIPIMDSVMAQVVDEIRQIKIEQDE